MILLKASLTWQLAVRQYKTLKPMVESGCGNLDYEKVRSSRYTLAQLSVLLLAGSVMYLGLYNMERQRIKRAKLRTIWFKNNVCLLALVRMIRHTDDVDKMKNLLMSISANFEINAVFGKLILIPLKT